MSRMSNQRRSFTSLCFTSLTIGKFSSHILTYHTLLYKLHFLPVSSSDLAILTLLNDTFRCLLFCYKALFLLLATPRSGPANNRCNNPPCSLSHRRRRISEAIFITACSMHDHDEEKRTEQNLFVRSGKSEAELVLDLLY